MSAAVVIQFFFTSQILLYDYGDDFALNSKSKFPTKNVSLYH